MVSISTKNGYHRVYNRYLGKQYTYPLGKVSLKEANLEKHRVDSVVGLLGPVIHKTANDEALWITERGTLVCCDKSSKPFR